jgi:preprotein translocase subunit SecE
VLQVQVLPGLPLLRHKEKGTMFEKLRAFFIESSQELRKVTWPQRKDVMASSTVVIAVSAFFMILIAVVDWAVMKGMDFIL